VAEAQQGVQEYALQKTRDGADVVIQMSELVQFVCVFPAPFHEFCFNFSGLTGTGIDQPD